MARPVRYRAIDCTANADWRAGQDMEAMNYLIQSNLVKRDDLDRLVAAFQATGLSYKLAQIIPFSHEVFVDDQPFNDMDVPLVVFGSTTMLNIARQRRWTPGVWWSDDAFNYRTYTKMYGRHMVNADAEYATFSTVPQFSGHRFIRPVSDGKAFVGEVIGGQQYETWRDAILALHIDTFASTPVLVATPKVLQLEYRFFVVEGKVRSGSLYHAGRHLMYRALEPDNEIDTGAWDYAQARVDQWQPDAAFVIDVAYMQDETYKVIELNCLNGAGFYHSDIEAVLLAVDTLANRNHALAK